MRRLLPAFFLVILIVTTAPAIGHLRDFIFATFPRDGVRALTVGFAVLVAAVFVVAVAQIRERRILRYTGLVFVAGLVWVLTVGFATDVAKVNVAERIHIIEYGLLAFLIYRALRPDDDEPADASLPIFVVCGATLGGLADEAVQFLAPQRVGEIRDIGLNVGAGIAGFLLALSLSPPARFRPRLEGRRRGIALAMLAVTVVASTIYLDVVHLGHEIEDEEVGRFRSRYSAAELHLLSAERAQSWATDPPTGLETWAIEDHYLSEAAWHAGHRNAALAQKDFIHAWLANRVLEKYYPAFLDLESFRGAGRHRLAPKRREKLDRHMEAHPHRPENYVSPVLASRIFLWPRGIVWGVAAAVLISLGWAARASPLNPSKPAGS